MSKYTAEEVANAILAAQGMITHAARKLGCTRKTVYNYIDRYVTVAEAVEDSRAKLGDQIETTLLTEALGKRNDKGEYTKEPNITALIFLAKTHPAMKERGYSQRTELTGADGGAMEVRFVYPDD
jgi:hypothetical protein